MILNFSSFDFVENQQAYFWISFLSLLYAFHTLINLGNKQYLTVFLLAIGLIIYDLLSKNKLLKNISWDDKGNFIQWAVNLAKENDRINARMEKKYAIAKALIRSNTILWISLKNFKRIGKHHDKAFCKIVTLIIQFYENYGRMLKEPYDAFSLDELILQKKEILNAIHEFELQCELQKDISKEVQQLSTVALMTLSKCIRVLRNKNKDFHKTAPYAANMFLDERLLY